MKTFNVEIKQCDYDQYDGFIIVAEDKKSAIKYLKDKYPKQKYGLVDWEHGYSVGELNPKDYDEETIILSSFNAG